MKIMYKIHNHGKMDSKNFFSDLEMAKKELEKRAQKYSTINLQWKTTKNKYQLFADIPKHGLKHFWIDTILVIK